MTKEPAKPAKVGTPKKNNDRGDPHARIDKLEALMRANGWTIPE